MIKQLVSQIYVILGGTPRAVSETAPMPVLEYKKNRIIYASADVVPTSTVTVLEHLFDEDVTIKNMLFSGNGDATICVKRNLQTVSTQRINRHNINIVLELDAVFYAGETVRVEITCDALGTSNYSTTILYR